MELSNNYQSVLSVGTYAISCQLPALPLNITVELTGVLSEPFIVMPVGAYSLLPACTIIYIVTLLVESHNCEMERNKKVRLGGLFYLVKVETTC